MKHTRRSRQYQRQAQIDKEIALLDRVIELKELLYEATEHLDLIIAEAGEEGHKRPALLNAAKWLEDHDL